MENHKTCSKCGQTKHLNFFYTNNGVYRSACKKCIITQNINYQSRAKPWRYKVSAIDRALYMQEYREKNKEKFVIYRKRFLENHPGYYKKYLQQKQS